MGYMTMTKLDWYLHVEYVRELTTACLTNELSCVDCVQIWGPCRKNLAINKFNELIEQVYNGGEK